MPTRIPFRFWLVGMALVFFIAGVVFRASAQMDFSITSPKSESVITGQSVTFDFALPKDFKLVDYQTHLEPMFGQGHIHLWIDQTPTPETAIEITSPYTITNLKYGQHSATAELVTNSHLSLIPKTLAVINFTTTPPQAPSVTKPVFILSVLSFVMIASALYLVSFYQKRFLPKLPQKPRRKSK